MWYICCIRFAHSSDMLIGYPICSMGKSDVRFAHWAKRMSDLLIKQIGYPICSVDFLMSKSDVRYAHYQLYHYFSCSEVGFEMNCFKSFNKLSRRELEVLLLMNIWKGEFCLLLTTVWIYMNQSQHFPSFSLPNHI